MRIPSLSPPSSWLSQPAHWSRVLLAISLAVLATKESRADTIFTENMGTPSGTTGIVAYAGGTAPATFQNKGTLTYGIGEQTTGGDVRPTSTSNIAGASGTGNLYLTATSGAYGFSIESINASAFTSLQLSYIYRKESASASASFSVDYWNGSAWVTIENTSAGLFNETATAATGWYAAKTLNLPAAAQISGLKLRFVKTGTFAIRLDDFKLTGTPAGGDLTPPTATLSPSNGATDVATATNLTLSFNEAIAAGTGSITIKKTVGDVLVTTIPISDPQVTISGSSVVINPTADLAFSTGYYVQIPAGALKDLANNSYAGITTTSGAGAWAFTTVAQDVTAPTVTSFSPANAATGVAINTSLAITFNEGVQQSIFSPDVYFVTVKDSANNVIASVDTDSFGSVSVSGAVATIPLPAPLAYNTTYHVEVTAGAFTDISGNSFAGITGSSTWSFTTVSEPVVPSLTAGTPYTQNFASFTLPGPFTPTPPDATTALPQGWTVSGADLSYDGDFGTGVSGGFRGNASVLAYQHTGASGVLVETLTLRNASGAEINNLVVGYTGRDNGPATGTVRNPSFVVAVNGTEVTGLAYSTSAGDNAVRTANLSGLAIANNALFTITWTSTGDAPGTGSRRQIGISAVNVAIGATPLVPTVSGSVPLAKLDYNVADFNATVVSEGSQPITARGFVYSLTSTNATPALGGTGVTTVTDPLIGADPYTTSIGGLNPATGYTVRAYATNSVGTSYSTAVTFVTLPLPPTYTGSYQEPFDNYDGTNPAGWTTISSGGTQGYAGAWGNVSGTGGFTGGVADPGALGYQHTGGTGTLTTTLKMFNGTGSAITSLPVAYLGRASRTTEGRSPTFVVSVNGSVVSDLAYTTLNNVDVSVSTTVTGLSIAPGALITITWVSERGDGSGSSKQIGLGEVVIGTGTTPTNTYASWKTANAGGQGPTADYDSDGVPNGVEYFFGATGSTFTPNPQPNAAGKISFPHPAATPGATYKILTSGNLTTWTDVTAGSAVEGNFITYTLPTGQGKLFVRLEVDVAP